MGPLVFVMAAMAGAPPDLEAVGIVLSRRHEACVAILRSGGRGPIVGGGGGGLGGRVSEMGAAPVSRDSDGQRVGVRLAGVPPPAPAPASAAGAPPPDADPTARSMERRE